MRRFRWIVGIAVGVVLLAMVVPAAQAAGAGHGKLVPASSRLAGLTGGQLLGEELRQLFELPQAENPLFGNGDSCFATGHTGKVLIVWTRPVAPTCTVKPGTPIFFFTFYSECSNREPPPFFGGQTEAGQRECALETLRELVVLDAIHVSIDAKPPINIHSDRYLAVSPQMTADLPYPNALGVSAGETTFVAAAWVGMIRPLAPGTHTIGVDIVTPDDTFSSQVIVNVVPGHGARVAAN
jgi:hypothetical protein